VTTPPVISLYGPGPGAAEQARPDFVLLGAGQLPDGSVEVWASIELNHAELEAETRVRDIEWPDALGAGVLPAVSSVAYTLRAGLRTFVIVRAPTYRAALANLAAHPGWEVTGG
jgi:hypothetical protein